MQFWWTYIRYFFQNNLNIVLLNKKNVKQRHVMALNECTLSHYSNKPIMAFIMWLLCTKGQMFLLSKLKLIIRFYTNLCSSLNQKRDKPNTMKIWNLFIVASDFWSPSVFSIRRVLHLKFIMKLQILRIPVFTACILDV